MVNGKLEPWDWNHPGWANEHLAVHAVSPFKDALVVEALAWTPGTNGTVKAKAFNLVTPEGPLADPAGGSERGRTRRPRTAAARPDRGGADRVSRFDQGQGAAAPRCSSASRCSCRSTSMPPPGRQTDERCAAATTRRAAERSGVRANQGRGGRGGGGGGGGRGQQPPTDRLTARQVARAGRRVPRRQQGGAPHQRRRPRARADRRVQQPHLRRHEGGADRRDAQRGLRPHRAHPRRRHAGRARVRRSSTRPIPTGARRTTRSPRSPAPTRRTKS